MVKIRNRDALLNRLEALGSDRVIEALGTVCEKAAQNVATYAAVSIAEGSVSGKRHVPSQPGQPPNNDTGVLAGNIEHTRTGPLTAQATSEAPYAAALEYGTSRMAERPYMRPAAARVRETIRDDALKAIRSLVRRR